MAETQTTTVSIEDVISLVVPPAAGGYLKLVCDESERYFQPLGGRWGGLPGQRDGVDNFVAAHPSEALLAIPGSRVTTVYPSVIVRIVAFEPPRAYPINLDKLIS